MARVIRREAPASTHRQGILVEFGVTEATVGSKNLFMTVQRVPPGARSEPHSHANCETADYVISGRIRVVYGPRLEHVIEAGPGEFIYVPANEPHYVLNPSSTEWVEVVLCRNAATEVVVDYRAAVEGLMAD